MLDHVGVQVADVEASVAFYLRTFAAIGMREAMRIPVGGTVVVGLAGRHRGPRPLARPGRRRRDP